jgi:hypothetical protein
MRAHFLGCLLLRILRKKIGIGLPEVFPCVLRRRLCCRRPIVRQRDRVIAKEREGEAEEEEARE